MPVDRAPNVGSDAGQNAQRMKKRRLRGACDACRTKKTKCDSAVRPGKVCTNCTLSNTPCRHDIPRRQKEKKIKQVATAYIESLETRIKKLEAYIRKIHPGENIDHVIDNHVRNQSRSPSASASPSGTPGFLRATDLRFPSPHTDSSSTTEDESDEPETNDLALAALTENMKKFTTATTAIDERFYGQASTFMFAKHVTDMRNEITGESSGVPDPNGYRRRIYWDLEPWEMSYVSSPEPAYIYPETDLLDNLISLYFERSNILIPVLHRPTFMKSMSLGQHHWDPLFGMTVLLVCALGSKYSQDPRVIVRNDTSQSGLSAGWHYFSQVQVYRKRMLYKSTTYDLQYYALAAMYLCGTSMPQASWTILAIGLRHAFEKGIHRRKGPRQVPSAEYELQKRAFWALICLDSAESSFVGRPCSMPLETYDLDYPIECDDEYWDTDDPETSFRQPARQPCSITAFVSFIKLCEILGFVLRTLYTNKKSRLLSGFIGTEWEGRMVAELDSSMNKWKDSLPEYLHWDSERRDETFFHQSVILHATFYYIQIQIHRPYLTKRSSLTLSSLAMCNNAARACSRILEVATTRGIRVLPVAITVAYTVGMVITLSIWGGQSIGYVGDPREDMENLRKCVNYLKGCERRWHSAGRLGDILTEAGVIHEYKPTIANRLPSSQPLPEYPESMNSTHILGYPSTTDINNIPPPVSGLDSTLSMDDWDLRRLMLTEMGYFPGQPNDSSHGGSDMFSNALTGYNTYSLQSEAAAPQMPAVAQTSSAQDNDLFAMWSDIPTPFTSLEEWDAYYRAHMGQP